MGYTSFSLIIKNNILQKREKRVIQNWQLLTKGLLIKEKLKRKYLLQPHLQVRFFFK